VSTLGDGAVVELRGVDKAFPGPAGPRRVLTGLDLRVGDGEIVAVAGRSGSGKTTVLTLVAGLESPDAGDVRVIDDAVAPSERPWVDVAILPQSLSSTYWRLSIRSRACRTAAGFRE
jgi:ABC-type multidrug transport system ATPase subunit